MDKLITGAKKLGLQLNSRQIEQFLTYYQELIDWNQRINLTTITDYEEVQIKHFLDSLTVILVWQPYNRDSYLIDVGTGAGMPGLPLKILFPEQGHTVHQPPQSAILIERGRMVVHRICAFPSLLFQSSPITRDNHGDFHLRSPVLLHSLSRRRHFHHLFERFF